MEEIDKNNLISINHLFSSTMQDKERIILLAKETERFIISHKWCDKILNGWFSMGWESILGVFLFEIVPTESNVDNFVWVVCGDLPSAYIDTESANNGTQALQCYVSLMEDWIKCVRNNQSTHDCYQLGVPPTMKFARMLESRIKIIKEEILNG